jgi:phospholipase/carboxylesterase
MSGARLSFVPPAPDAPGLSLEPGEYALELSPDRDGYVYVPDTADKGAPVMVFLHGAAGSYRREMRVWLSAADRFGAVIVMPESRGPSWDVLHGGFGPDVEFIAGAMTAVASQMAVDWSRACIGGVSDGASYALSLGLANGDLFDSVVAFSPGFIVLSEPVGQPRIFMSHGTSDSILPIDATSRRLAPGLGEAGYHVTYCEFEGGHTVPPPIADRAFGWWLEGGTPA